MIGRQLGSYSIESLLGEGGFATVYKATHATLGHQVAIKVLRPGIAAKEGFRERFRTEARLLANLDHPHIVRAVDLVEDERDVAFVLEYVEGKALDEVLRADPYPSWWDTTRALELFGQVLDGIHYAHTRSEPIIHRDLKPSNLFVKIKDARIEAKVMDFGIAKIVGEGKSKTRTGALMGTLYYMSPEQILGTKDVDVRTDIYALGCVLYEILTGHVPFDAETDFTLMQAHLAGSPRPPIEINPKLPEALQTVVLKALAREKEDRYPTAEAFKEALLGVEVEPGPLPQHLDTVSRSETEGAFAETLAPGEPEPVAPKAAETAPTRAERPEPGPAEPAPEPPARVTVHEASDASSASAGPASAEPGRHVTRHEAQVPTSAPEMPSVEAPVVEAGSSGSGSGRVIAIVAVLLLVVGGAVGAYMVVGGQGEPEAPVTEADVGSDGLEPGGLGLAGLEMMKEKDAGGESSPVKAPVASRRIFPTSAKASSELVTKRRYVAYHAFDGESETAWHEAVEGDGVGQWVEARFDRPRVLTEVTFDTGFNYRSPRMGDLFALNAHVRKMTITFDGGDPVTREIAANERRVTLEGLDVTTQKVRFTIDAVYPGEKWQDLSISEVVFKGAPLEVEPLVPVEPLRVNASSEIKKHPAYFAFDGERSTAWNHKGGGNGAGSWLEARMAAPVKLRKITLDTGYSAISPRHGDLFVANAHMRRVRIDAGGVVRVVDVPEDKREVVIDDLDVMTDTVRITAEATWPGQKWDDLAISEVRLFGQQAP